MCAKDVREVNGWQAVFPAVPYSDPGRLMAAIADPDQRVFVISDTHLFHVRLWTVLRPTAEGGRNPRNTELILENWRRLVRPDDVVLHLGDVALGIPVSEYRQRIGWLPGEIWLVPGNHDRTVEKLAQFREMGWNLVRPFELNWSDRPVRFTHEPIPLLSMPENGINVHGHIHHNPAPDAQHVNCCVEWLGYEPVDLRPILSTATASDPVPRPRRRRKGDSPKSH